MYLFRKLLRAKYTVAHPSCATTCLPRQAVAVEVLPTRQARLDNGLCLSASSLAGIGTGESWLDVLGYVLRYILSSHGKVVSLLYKGGPRERLLKKLRARTYPGASLCNGVGVKQTGLARLVAQHFLPPPADTQFMCAVYKDENWLSTSAKNLQWVNPADLNDILTRHYLHRHGEQRAPSKLTAEEVAHIQELSAAGFYKQQMTNELEASRPATSQMVSPNARRYT